MNIELPYSWIKEFVRTKLSPEEFAARLSLSGPSVDRWRKMGEGLDGVVVGEVSAIENHPDADRLRIAKTRVGKSDTTIVCGGSNLRVGMKVAVALPGAAVRWHGEGEPVVLQKTKVRGVVSEGMICAANEIGLFDAFPHEEREILDLSFLSVAPGTPLAEALELDDTIFEIEVTSNRPDAFCAVGMAREAAAVLDAPFLWKPASPPGPIPSDEVETVEIQLEAPKLCPRYQAAVVKNVQVKPSPWWMQKRLIAVGLRPISNIVDITNYVMLETGQPLHAFDADRLEKKNGKYFLAAREAKKGEKILALDGKEYDLTAGMLVIADAKRPAAIAGVMGGEKTGVTRDTTTVIFEAATFDPVSIRRTARKLNLPSDSSLRFEKGLSTESTTAALARAVELAQKISGGAPASPLYDRRAKPYRAPVFSWDPKDTIRAMGVATPVANMKKMLQKLGFSVRAAGKTFKVTVPYWRDHDIEASQDLDEEVARLYGYHNIPAKLPDSDLAEWPDQTELLWEDRLREFFRGAGFTETYSNSFVSRDLLKKAMWDVPVLVVQNPLSEDLAVMRPSLVPSILQVVADNEIENPTGSIFEAANTYMPRKGELPYEGLMLGGAVWGESPNGELFFQAKGVIEAMMKQWNIDAQIKPSELKKGQTLGHPGRRMSIMVDGEEIGIVGEIHPTVLERFGIKHRVAVFNFAVMNLVSKAQPMTYEPLPQFPPVRRDISFIVSERTAYDEIVGIMRREELLRRFELFDVYRGEGIPAGQKSLAFHLSFADPSRTLTSEEADRALSSLATELKKKLGADVREA